MCTASSAVSEKTRYVVAMRAAPRMMSSAAAHLVRLLPWLGTKGVPMRRVLIVLSVALLLAASCREKPQPAETDTKGNATDRNPATGTTGTGEPVSPATGSAAAAQQLGTVAPSAAATSTTPVV